MNKLITLTTLVGSATAFAPVNTQVRPHVHSIVPCHELSYDNRFATRSVSAQLFSDNDTFLTMIVRIIFPPSFSTLVI